MASNLLDCASSASSERVIVASDRRNFTAPDRYSTNFVNHSLTGGRAVAGLIAERWRPRFDIMERMKRKAARGRYLAVELSHIDLVRGGRRVLRDLRWRIRPGERWVLQGANGAGKTQLLKLIAGDVWPEPRGDTRRRYHWRGELWAEPYLVKEEIAYLGAERQDRYQHYDWNHRVSTIVGTGLQRSDTPAGPLTAPQRSQVARWLRRLGIHGLAGRRFLGLSQGERRLVLLARALAWRPAFLLLDEPLNGLDASHRARILAVLAWLSRSDLPWIYASHRLEEVPAAVTHRARLERGQLRVGAWRPRGLSRSAAGTLLPDGAPARPLRQPLIELRNASVWRGGRLALRRLTLQIRRGECWVVHGANGSGKSTFLATLRGEHAPASHGSVWRRWLAPGVALSQFQQHVGLIAPELQAALPRHLSALECVVAGRRAAHDLDGPVSAAEQRAALRSLGELGAQRLARRRIAELSYGQARRVLFARALARGPDIVLLDEPYTGLDATTTRRLRARVEHWIRGGRTVVIASHHRDDWPRAAGRELELAAGRARYCGPLRSVPTVRRAERS
jgi:molybdate transport system ATP-binding protein